MTRTLLVLHGFTQNGAVLRAHLAAFAPRLSPVEVICLDAPHPCSDAAVERLRAGFGVDVAPPPWLAWWDASDDGTVYHGLEATMTLVEQTLRRYPRAGILGFSQGAILGAAIAALSRRGELPEIAYAVLVAGRTPRALALAAAMEQLIDVPSLHVWGTRDSYAVQEAPALVEKFEPSSRQTVTWDGPHTLPTRGPAADAIAAFVTARSD